MRQKILIAISLIVVIPVVIGCPSRKPTTPEKQEPVVVDTFPSDLQSSAPDASAYTEKDYTDQSCGRCLNVTGKAISMSPGLLSSTAHFILVFDAGWTKLSPEKPDMSSLKIIYNCFLDNLLMSGDRLSVIPYGWTIENRMSKASWFSEVPLPEHRERVLGEFLPLDPVVGIWDRDWAMMDVIDYVIEAGAIDDPIIIIAISPSGDEVIGEENKPDPPNGLDKYLELFQGGSMEPETVTFKFEENLLPEDPVQSSAGTPEAPAQSAEPREYTAEIIISEAARSIETKFEGLRVILRLDNEKPIYPGSLVTLSLDMPERLEQAVLTGQAKVVWRSGGKVTGDLNPAGNNVKWVYQELGEFEVEAGVIWSDGEENYFLSCGMKITIESGIEPPEEESP